MILPSSCEGTENGLDVEEPMGPERKNDEKMTFPLSMGNPIEPIAHTEAQIRGHSQRILLALILAPYFMIVIDVSIVITALPHIRDTFGVSQAGLSWVQN